MIRPCRDIEKRRRQLLLMLNDWDPSKWKTFKKVQPLVLDVETYSRITPVTAHHHTQNDCGN